MTAYYNEFDPYAAEWLRNLIKAGHIAPGDVDSRSIADVRPADLVGYTQCHFFAGIGVWSHALRLAGWTDDRPVWTGSCPCQPFSAAGKQSGMSDERHLWPVWFKLIRQCQPDVVFGEQVESAIRHGWLDLVQADMEGIGYAFAPVGIPAAGFGAPHIRQRLWFVAEDHLLTDRSSQRLAISNEGQRGWREPDEGGISDGQAARRDQDASDATGCGSVQQLAHPTPGGLGINGSAPGSTGHAALGDSVSWVDYADGRDACAERKQRSGEQRLQPVSGGAGLMGNTQRTRLERLTGHGDGDGKSVPPGSVAAAGEPCGTGPTNGHWRDADWIFCRDGKWRPVESGTFPLAHGAPNRVGRLRAYGNAIVAQVAAEVIGAYLDVLST